MKVFGFYIKVEILFISIILLGVFILLNDTFSITERVWAFLIEDMKANNPGFRDFVEFLE